MAGRRADHAAAHPTTLQEAFEESPSWLSGFRRDDKDEHFAEMLSRDEERFAEMLSQFVEEPPRDSAEALKPAHSSDGHGDNADTDSACDGDEEVGHDLRRGDDTADSDAGGKSKTSHTARAVTTADTGGNAVEGVVRTHSPVRSHRLFARTCTRSRARRPQLLGGRATPSFCNSALHCSRDSNSRIVLTG